MEGFRKTINGVDFAFHMPSEEKYLSYQVWTDNFKFKMEVSNDGIWKICDPVPIWIKDLEEDLGLIIEENKKP
jgi:hypothetical protein